MASAHSAFSAQFASGRGMPTNGNAPTACKVLCRDLKGQEKAALHDQKYEKWPKSSPSGKV